MTVICTGAWAMADPAAIRRATARTSARCSTILRLDVDGADPYAIPPANPFSGRHRGAKEIYAYGLPQSRIAGASTARRATSAGDVGQGARGGRSTRSSSAATTAGTCAKGKIATTRPRARRGASSSRRRPRPRRRGHHHHRASSIAVRASRADRPLRLWRLRPTRLLHDPRSTRSRHPREDPGPRRSRSSRLLRARTRTVNRRHRLLRRPLPDGRGEGMSPRQTATSSTRRGGALVFVHPSALSLLDTMAGEGSQIIVATHSRSSSPCQVRRSCSSTTKGFTASRVLRRPRARAGLAQFPEPSCSLPRASGTARTRR